MREILDRADTVEEINANDVYISDVQALLDFFVYEFSDSRHQEVIHIGLLEARDVLHARIQAVPVEWRATLTAILETIDMEIKQIEGG